MPIEVDGGLNNENMRELQEAVLTLQEADGGGDGLPAALGDRLDAGPPGNWNSAKSGGFSTPFVGGPLDIFQDGAVVLEDFDCQVMFSLSRIPDTLTYCGLLTVKTEGSIGDDDAVLAGEPISVSIADDVNALLTAWIEHHLPGYTFLSRPGGTQDRGGSFSLTPFSHAVATNNPGIGQFLRAAEDGWQTFGAATTITTGQFYTVVLTISCELNLQAV